MLLSLCAATDGLDLSGPGVRTSSIRSCSEVENWFSRSAALTILPWLSLALLGKLLLFSTSLPVVGFFFILSVTYGRQNVSLKGQVGKLR